MVYFSPVLGADAVRCHHRHDVGRRMPLHGALPMRAGIDARILRFGAYRRGIEQHLRTHQGHGARGLGNHWSQQMATPSLA